MATLTNLSLTTSDGTPFNLDANKIIYGYDDANSKCNLTYALDKGVNDTQILSIDTNTLYSMSTDILFYDDVLDENGNFIKTTLFCGANVIKIYGTGQMSYNNNVSSELQEFYLDNSNVRISEEVKTTIALTDHASGTAYYANGLNMGGISEIADSTSTNTTLVSAVVAAAGTGVGDAATGTVVGGTFGTAAKLKVDTTKPVSLATNAAGSSYNVADTILTAGGTASTHATLTVTHVKIVALPAIAAAGNGYNVGDTFTLTTGTGTQEIFTVATLTGGAGTGVATFTRNSGSDYTVRPTLSGTAATTHTSGTGNNALTLVLVAADFGVKTTSITIAGSYTVGSATFTQNTTSGSGTGATFNTVVYGVNTFHITDGGDYSAAPTNPVSVTLSAGSGFTITGTFSGSITNIQFDNKQSATLEILLVNETPTEIQTAINAL